MNLQAVKTAVTSRVGRQLLVTQKHSPTILFAAGVVGVVATSVLAARATLKLESVVDEAQHDLDKANNLEHPDYSEQDRKKDVVLIYARTAGKLGKLYGLPVLVGAASIGCLAGSHVILNRRNVAITAAYAALDKGFREYRRRVVDEYGDEKDREFRFGTYEETVTEKTEDGAKTKVVKRIGGAPSIYARFFDEQSTSWDKTPAFNQLFIQCQQNYANDLLRMRGHVFLNEVYDMLGLSRSKEGAVVGWVGGCEGGDNYIDFGVFKGDLWAAKQFVEGDERSILLDFNVDGVIYDKI